MADSFTIDEVRVIVDQFNRKCGLNLIEATNKLQSMPAFVYPYPQIKVDVRGTRMDAKYKTLNVAIVRMRWGSVESSDFIEFRDTAEREIFHASAIEYNEELIETTDKIIDLYREL